MKDKQALITGSGGLIGSESTKFFISQGYKVVGIDNDMRAYFFGSEASTKTKVQELQDNYPNDYQHFQIDIRDYNKLETVFKDNNFSIIIHTAAS
jgi:CDP-paratose 2-epimerase